MARQVFKNNADMEQVIEVVGKFHVSGDRLRKQNFPVDINQYKTLQQLNDTFSKLKRRDAPSKKDLKGTGELVYDGENVYVIAPRNWEGSCKWGSGAKWCIAQESTSSHTVNQTCSILLFLKIYHLVTKITK
jgi:hypothetical protein